MERDQNDIVVTPKVGDAMSNLQGKLLVAMPTLADSYFQRSVTYVCEHNDEGAMGLVINQPIELSVSELLKHVEALEQTAESGTALEKPVFSGGPVSPERGFVLHSAQPGYGNSMTLPEALMVTTSKDILMSLGTEQCPEKYLVTLGYAGWEAGQLEQEIAKNNWLTLPASPDLIFDVPVEKRWEEAVKRLGFDVWQISPFAGHA